MLPPEIKNRLKEISRKKQRKTRNEYFLIHRIDTYAFLFQNMRISMSFKQKISAYFDYLIWLKYCVSEFLKCFIIQLSSIDILSYPCRINQY